MLAAFTDLSSSHYLVLSAVLFAIYLAAGIAMISLAT